MPWGFASSQTPTTAVLVLIYAAEQCPGKGVHDELSRTLQTSNLLIISGAHFPLLFMGNPALDQQFWWIER